MLKRLPLLLPLLLLSLGAGAQSRVQQYLDSLCATEPFRSARLGVLAVKARGDTIACISHMQKLEPASNTKLITTGMALANLGSGYRIRTGIGYSGTIEDGTLKGDLYIIGGGDPTIASRDSIATYIDGLFSRWKGFVSKAGIKKIEGRIIGDGRFFDGDSEQPSWLYEDIGTYYGTGGNALSFYRNKQDFKVSAGAKPGDPLSIEPSYPQAPWMKFSYRCSTGKAGTGDMLYLYTNDLAPVAEIRGTFACDRKPKTVECSNKFAAMTCAMYFWKYLETNGIRSQGYADVDNFGMVRRAPGDKGEYPAATDISLLGQTESPDIGRISYIINQRSDNVYAESLLRVLGKALTGSASYDSTGVAVRRALSKIGVDGSYGISQVDGSGLSRKNYISPDFFCRFLRAMLYSPVSERFVSTLTIPGTGSQAGRLRNSDKSTRERIRYKSDSMEGVRCYSGYIRPADGGKEDTIVFSIMLNSYSGPYWIAMSRIDRIISLLAREN